MIEFAVCRQCQRPFVKGPGSTDPCHRCRGAGLTWVVTETNEYLALASYEGQTLRFQFRVSDLMTDLHQTRMVLQDLLEEKGIPKKMYAVHWSNSAEFGTNASETLCVCLTLDRAKSFIMQRLGGSDATTVNWTEHNTHGRSWVVGHYQITEEDLVL